MAPTPEPNLSARDLAERVVSAYAQQASGPLHPVHEQTLLARLSEALEPIAGKGSNGAILDAANAAIDSFETAEPGIRGPRLAQVDLAAGTVTVAAAA